MAFSTNSPNKYVSSASQKNHPTKRQSPPRKPAVKTGISRSIFWPEYAVYALGVNNWWSYGGQCSLHLHQSSLWPNRFSYSRIGALYYERHPLQSLQALNLTIDMSGMADSNCRPLAPKASTLPTELIPV